MSHYVEYGLRRQINGTKEDMMINTQMELDFGGRQLHRSVQHRRRRLPNAKWWFGQIRRIIAAPGDHPKPRPIQCRLALAPSR